MKIISWFVVCIMANYSYAIPRLDHKIVGGKNASILQYPYQVSIKRYNSHICGGSIFHTLYILTAAHCVAGGMASQFSIRIGSTVVNKGGQILKICTIISNENYNSDNLDNDIAILKVCSPIVFSKNVLPIALPGPNEEITANTKAFVSGWGYQAESGIVSPVLNQVQLPIISPNDCVKAYSKYADVTNNMICAGIKNKGGKDACQGDSGGPLRANGKLMGIVSWGFGCARPQFPGVYTKVSKYRDWIKSVTNY